MFLSADEEASAHLFEVAWEVCAQIGGIYTVIRSKAPDMLAEWGDRYHLVGPYDAQRTEAEFEALEPNGITGEVLAALRAEGVKCHYGRWLIAGYPRVILLDYRASYDQVTRLKYRIWLDHNIGLPPGDTLSEHVLLFSSLVERLLEAFRRRMPVSVPIIAHFHEWMTGLTIPMMKKRDVPVATVFTTHATVIGRAYCADRDDFYDVLDTMNPDVESGQRGIYHLYCIERAAAATADMFTTVSDVTAAETTKLLARKPDVITPNGLRVQRFEALHEFQNLHRHYKEQLHDFVMGHFFGSYSFDLDQTIYLFLAGRYEYRNKGMDVYLEALGRLNQRLRGAGSKTTVVAFLVTKAATHGLNGDVLSSRFGFEELKRFCDEAKEEMGKRLRTITATGRLPEREELLRADDVVQLKRIMQSCRRSQLPIVVTHNLQDDAFDPVIGHIRRLGLFNSPDDRVKVVYHPDFITPASPLFRMEYDQFVRGCHLGVFPSYYEPWGYTPAECTALGIPSVTSDLSGFGSFIQENVSDHDDCGLSVLQRRHTPFDKVVEQLANTLYRFCRLNRRQRIQIRNRVESLSDLLSWQRLVQHYFEAERLALRRSARVRLHQSAPPPGT
jgi:glycogen(starch) synthase